MIVAMYLVLFALFTAGLVYGACAYDLLHKQQSYPLDEIELKTRKIKDRINLFNRTYHVHATEELHSVSLSSDPYGHPKVYPYSHNVGHIS